MAIQEALRIITLYYVSDDLAIEILQTYTVSVDLVMESGKCNLSIVFHFTD